MVETSPPSSKGQSTGAAVVASDLVNVHSQSTYDSGKVTNDSYDSITISNVSSEPSIEAGASHASTFASQDSLRTVDDYPVLNTFIDGLFRCVDDIQDGTVCRDDACSSGDLPRNKPSLLYRSKTGNARPSSKLQIRNSDRERYLNKFTNTRKLKLPTNDPDSSKDAKQDVTKGSTLTRIRSLVQRKTRQKDVKEARRNDDQNTAARQHHRRKKGKKKRDSNSSSLKGHLSSVVEGPNTDEVPKASTDDARACSPDKPSSFRNKVSNLMEFRSNDSLSGASDLQDAMTPRASAATKSSHSPSKSPISTSIWKRTLSHVSPTKSTGKSPSSSPSKSVGRSPPISPSKSSGRSSGRSPHSSPSKSSARSPHGSPSKSSARSPSSSPSKSSARSPLSSPSKSSVRSPPSSPSKSSKAPLSPTRSPRTKSRNIF